MSHRVKNLTIEDGFVKNPDRTYYEEYFEHLPLSLGEVTLSNGDNDFTLFQPANTFIKEIYVVCHTAVAFSSGTNVGICVHNSAYNALTSGNVVAGTTTNIISSGTALAINTLLTLSLDATATVKFTSSNRSLFCRITSSNAPSTAGKIYVVPIFAKLNSSIYQPNSHMCMIGTNEHKAEYDSSNGYSGIKLTTSTTTNDQSILSSKNLNNTPISDGVLRPAGRIEFETSIIIPDITTLSFIGGLKLTPVPLLTTDSNQAMFMFGQIAPLGTSILSNNILFVYSKDGTYRVTDTGLAVVADREYHLKISMNKHKKISIFINGVQYGIQNSITTTVPTIATNSYDESVAMSNVSLYPVVGIQTTSANSRSVIVNYIKCSRDSKKVS